MGNAADTLVSKNPTRVAQLKGPVLAYLKMRAASQPFNGTDQDLYMAVFYPAYRRKPINTAFPSKVIKSNPGIRTPGDYISLVNKQILSIQLTPSEWTALKDTANALHVDWESLYKLINFESTWNPQAKNKISGARGLLQFMPSTALDMGYKGSIGMGFLLLFAGIGFLAAKKLKLLK
jgi:soluble lytic murein transglycosylase-like protein